MSEASERGRFITLEGPDGSGKTTAARHLAEWLRGRGERALLTGEPGGTPLGEEVRRLVLHSRSVSDDLDPRADALLFAAARAQHTARVILPALERGEHVICARYLDSSLVYQGAAYGIDAGLMLDLQRFATYDTVPDMTILVDVPVEVGLARKRRGEWNRFEDTEGVAFFETVRRAYLALADAEPQRYRVVDGSGSVEETDVAVRGAVDSRGWMAVSTALRHNRSRRSQRPVRPFAKEPAHMKLVTAIVHSEDAGNLVDALLEKEFRATRLQSSGGFLKQGNATILVGVEDDQVDAVLEIVSANCHSRRQFVNPMPPIMEPGEFYMPYPVEVEVGGATVFVLPVERFERL